MQAEKADLAAQLEVSAVAGASAAVAPPLATPPRPDNAQLTSLFADNLALKEALAAAQATIAELSNSSAVPMAAAAPAQPSAEPTADVAMVDSEAIAAAEAECARLRSEVAALQAQLAAAAAQTEALAAQLQAAQVKRPAVPLPSQLRSGLLLQFSSFALRVVPALDK